MSEQQEAQPTSEAPPRRKPGRKPGAGANKPVPGAPPAREIAMNPVGNGNVLVHIRMELPLQLGIELLSAAAEIQGKLNGEEARPSASPFPAAKPSTRWVGTDKQAG